MSRTPTTTWLYYIHETCGTEWVTTTEEVARITRCPNCDTDFTLDSNTLQPIR